MKKTFFKSKYLHFLIFLIYFTRCGYQSPMENIKISNDDCISYTLNPTSTNLLKYENEINMQLELNLFHEGIRKCPKGNKNNYLIEVSLPNGSLLNLLGSQVYRFQMKGTIKLNNKNLKSFSQIENSTLTPLKSGLTRESSLYENQKNTFILRNINQFTKQIAQFIDIQRESIKHE